MLLSVVGFRPRLMSKDSILLRESLTSKSAAYSLTDALTHVCSGNGPECLLRVSPTAPYGIPPQTFHKPLNPHRALEGDEK